MEQINKSEIKYLLQNKKYIEAEIADLQFQIDELKSVESVSIAGISYGERVKSSNISNTTEQQAISNLGKLAEVQVEKIKLETQIKRVMKGMESLTELEQRVLTMKYIDKISWKIVRAELKHEDGNCSYLAAKAIDTLCKILN